MGGQPLPCQGRWAPTCRGVLLRDGRVFLTRGSSSCTISPLAKIRTILPGAMGPCWAAPFPRPQKPERNNFSEIRRCLPSVGTTLVTLTEQTLQLMNYKERNKCII